MVLITPLCCVDSFILNDNSSSHTASAHLGISYGFGVLTGSLLPRDHDPLQFNQRAQMFSVYVPTRGCWQVDHARTLKHQIAQIIDFPESPWNCKKHLPYMYLSGTSTHMSFTLNFLPSPSVCLTVCQCMEVHKTKGYLIFLKPFFLILMSHLYTIFNAG